MADCFVTREQLKFAFAASCLAVCICIPMRSAFGQTEPMLVGIEIRSDKLFRIDKQTGAITEIGPIGYDGVTGLWYDTPRNRLIGVDVASDQLLQINPFTGASSVMVDLAVDNLAGIFVHPDTGVFYSMQNVANFLSDVETDRLVTIDPSTGMITDVGETGFRNMGNLAFDPASGTVYATDSSFTRQLVTIDLATGQGTPVGYMGSDFYGPVGLTFDTANQSLIGSEIETPRLIRIDINTGDASLIAPLPFARVQFGSIRSLAFVPVVPEPATSVLAIFGVGMFSKRRRHRTL